MKLKCPYFVFQSSDPLPPPLPLVATLFNGRLLMQGPCGQSYRWDCKRRGAKRRASDPHQNVEGRAPLRHYRNVRNVAPEEKLV